MSIDLRSDTFSLPTPAMRAAMTHATVGDDYYGEDTEASQLEARCSDRFGMEAAVFVTSGMLSNQLAVAAQVRAGNEIIVESRAHMHLFESAQYASLCHVVLHPWRADGGVLLADDVQNAIEAKPRESRYAQVELVAVENTIASRQGKVFPLDVLRTLRAFTQDRGLALHMDGARVFNAHRAAGVALETYGRLVDTLTISFSKGLGAPFGSMLLGPSSVIARARDLRTRYGSGFHQVGFNAAAASFAFEHQLERLDEDHRLARRLARLLADRRVVIDLDGVETNMVSVDLRPWGLRTDECELRCRDAGLLVSGYPPHEIRFVTCRNVSEPDVLRAAEIFAGVLSAARSRTERADV